MQGSHYSFLARLLHRVSVGSKIVSEISFDIEKALFLKNDTSPISNDNPVFISGLARSGTTVLMRCLYETQRFASLTYTDMPFILAPNLGNKLMSGRRTTSEYKERVHKDGIFINNESPEAFDEVFWKVFLNDMYIQKDKLMINKISSDVIELYNNYIKLILLKNYKGYPLRYLSKNNNNILRIHSILQYFPNSYIIIPFRDPLQHALSLLNQHQHFCTIQQNNRFVLDYMNWLGHHEFGLNQKPFLLNNESIFTELLRYDKMDVNYWLLSWLNYHSYVADHYSEKCILFSYEQFSEDSQVSMHQLFEKIGLQTVQFGPSPFKSTPRTCNKVNGQILDDCMNTHDKLLQLTKKRH